MRAFIVLLASMVLLEPVLAAGVNFHEAFVGMPLELDTKIETPAVNSKIQVLTPKNTGEIVEFQIFVPAAAGKSAVGFNIEFELVGKTFLNNFSQLTGTAHDGSTLLPIGGRPVVSALMLSKPAFPSTGYLGTVRMTVTGSITEGSVLRIKAATIGDVNADGDVLTVSNALITFSNNTPPIPGDIDLDGDVDFSDFLTFTKNYGRTGPKPSTQEKTIIVSVRDTVQIVKRDTLYITRRDTVRFTVRDTVYLSGSAPPTQPTIPTKGSNANAISSLDLVGVGTTASGNGVDDKVVQGKVSGRGTKIVVEVFATGLSTGLTGADTNFDIDNRLLKITSVTAPSVFPLILPSYDNHAIVGAFSRGVPPNGFLMTVTFETVVDVTGLEFSIGIKSLQVAVSSTDRDNLTAGRIFFNSSENGSGQQTTSGSINLDLDMTTGFQGVLSKSVSNGSVVEFELFANGVPITNSQGVEVTLEFDPQKLGGFKGASSLFPVVINSTTGNKAFSSAVIFGAPKSQTINGRFFSASFGVIQSLTQPITIKLLKVDFGGGQIARINPDAATITLSP